MITSLLIRPSSVALRDIASSVDVRDGITRTSDFSSGATTRLVMSARLAVSGCADAVTRSRRLMVGITQSRRRAGSSSGSSQSHSRQLPGCWVPADRDGADNPVDRTAPKRLQSRSPRRRVASASAMRTTPSPASTRSSAVPPLTLPVETSPDPASPGGCHSGGRLVGHICDVRGVFPVTA